jgi:hypothetical protein
LALDRLATIDRRTFFSHLLLRFGCSLECLLSFAMICEKLVGHVDTETFTTKFYVPLLALGKDKVPNVRLIVARILSTLLSNGRNTLVCNLRG